MEVILLKDVANLGKRGEVVDVKAGYARKHLLPDGVAIAVTEPVNIAGYCGMGKTSLLLRVAELVEPEVGLEAHPAGGQPINGLRSALGQVRTAHDEVREAYADLTRRDVAWRALQESVGDSLWAAVEHLGDDDPHRRQLADVLDAAVSKLEAFQLDERHLAAIDSTLARLSADAVTDDDVDACEREWEAARVATVPALRSAFEEWLTTSFSGIEDGG